MIIHSHVSRSSGVTARHIFGRNNPDACLTVHFGQDGLVDSLGSHVVSEKDLHTYLRYYKRLNFISGHAIRVHNGKYKIRKQ